MLKLPITNRFMHKFRCNSAVYTTTNGSDNSALGTANLSYTADFFSDELFLHFEIYIRLFS